MNLILIDLIKKSDSRGYLFEILRNQGQLRRNEFGLIYFNVVNPGITKGNHYHLRKVEWYCVVRGVARVKLRERTTGDINEVTLCGDAPQLLRINPGITHNITNVGHGEMCFIGYIDEPYDENDTDTFAESV